MNGKDVTVVLAHATRADGSSWPKAIDLLHQAGRHAGAVTGATRSAPFQSTTSRLRWIAKHSTPCPADIYDRMIYAENRRFMAESAGATISAYPLDHGPMLGVPELVVEMIQAAANAKM